jgi:hypothetical protein
MKMAEKRRGELMEDANKRWSEVKKALSEFGKFLSPSVASDVGIKVEAAAWRKRDNSSEFKYLPPEGFLPSKLCGVYLLFDDKEQLLYVGVARVNFDKRVWTHEELHWRCLDIISFKPEHLFLAAALEEFLIDKLNPVRNKNMKR